MNIEFITRTDFQSCDTIEHALRLFHELNHAICKETATKREPDYKKDYMKKATHLLFANNVLKLISAFRNAVTGFYPSCMSLLRDVYEATLTIRYMKIKPEMAERWIKEPDRFQFNNHDFSEVIFRGDEELKEQFNAFYRKISEYVHPLRDGSIGCVIPLTKDKAGIITMPMYKPLSVNDCLGTMIFIIKHLGRPVIELFTDYIKDYEDLIEDLNEIAMELDEEYDRLGEDYNETIKEIKEKFKVYKEVIEKMRSENKKSGKT